MGKDVDRDVLWAPWRMAYVTSDKKEASRPVVVAPDGDPNCFVCQAAADSIENDRERLVVGRTQNTIAILNRYPYNNGHLLIAPKRHVAKLGLLTDEERREILDELTYWVDAVEKTMNAEGFNVGLNLGRVAGAGLPGHLHWHIVPRWNGDASFITTIGSARAIPQALDAAWQLLRRE